jgi:predicted nucleic acid-binding protein
LGTLALPTNGSVYVDANTIIYRVEAVRTFLDVAKPLWDALDAGTQAVVTSELSLLEVLVKPLQLGDIALQSLFQGTLYATPGFACVAITRQTLETAARLRTTAGLKTPDAIHAATALIEHCTLFVTNDPIFRRVPGLTVAILSEIAAAP